LACSHPLLPAVRLRPGALRTAGQRRRRKQQGWFLVSLSVLLSHCGGNTSVEGWFPASRCCRQYCRSRCCGAVRRYIASTMTRGRREMTTANAAKSGTFKIGGDLAVNRLGFGAMRIVGKGVWGEPEDRDEALRTLKRVPELGINLIDTADSYGPEISERLIREALYPYKGLVIATKGGLLRPAPNQWEMCGRPDYLRQQVFISLRRLGVERIDLWQLHRVDPNVPRDEQFSAIAAMQKEGLIRHVGLSEVGVEQITAA